MEITYTLFRARQLLIEKFNQLGYTIAPDEIRAPVPGVQADLAIPVFRLAKTLGKNPNELATAISPRLDLSATLFASAKPLNGYINLKFHPERFACAVFADYCAAPDKYGSFTLGKGKTVVIDYSSPNIAKPFSVGHLRSTVIGQALKNILSYLGYQVIGDNHLGDWGTQFGKLLAAYGLWGNETQLNQNPTLHLLDLYVQFHQKAKQDPALEIKARDWFRRLEQGDPEARNRWQQFVLLSLKEFEKIYQLLGITFDVTLGESFYAPFLQDVIDRALQMGVARKQTPPRDEKNIDDEVNPEEPVVLIPLDQMGITVPLILQKSDGTSLYATREIATVEYRIKTWHPEKILYVVGNEQELYFKQFNAALKLLGITTPCIHIGFGLIRLPQGKLSTREGRVILLEDVIKEAIERAKKVVMSRDLPENEKADIARKVGIGAIKYADLSQNRRKDVVFDWDRMLSLDGDSAPYLQYAYTRTRSILRKASPTNLSSANPSLLIAPEEQALLLDIARFPDAILSAAENYEPHRIANHLYNLARDFSTFYDRIPVLNADTGELQLARLALVEMTGTILKTGLGLLGIEVMERM
ncbi:arginine--tRNA ligase [candidate division WOR-3 bacterium]|nr:arginine--tRNA ligase [candidate division WOR-3 bacterium]